jgi:hypothetical protein
VDSNNESLPSSLLYWLNGFRQDKVTHIRRLLAFCSLDKLLVLLNQYEDQVAHLPTASTPPHHADPAAEESDENDAA